MDYKKIFNQAYGLYNKQPPPIVSTDDIIMIKGVPYQVLKRFGKFHRLFNLNDFYEQLIRLNEVSFTVVMSQQLKQEIIGYKKPDLNIKRYYNKQYLIRKLEITNAARSPLGVIR